MVERQPEKLKVVGSSPIPDIMFLFSFIIIIILNNILDFGNYTFVLINLAWLIFTIWFGGDNNIITKNNFYFYYNFFLIKIRFLYLLM